MGQKVLARAESTTDYSADVAPFSHNSKTVIENFYRSKIVFIKVLSDEFFKNAFFKITNVDVKIRRKHNQSS